MNFYRTCILLIAGVTAGAIAAQETTGGLQVIVEVEDGSRLAGTVVRVRSPEHLGSRALATDAGGVASFAGLTPSRRYVVVTRHRDFTVERTPVTVRSGSMTTVRVVLRLQPVIEEIEVAAPAPFFDLTSAATGQDVTLELTESLPTERSYQSYLQLVPGVLPVDPSEREPNPASRSGLNFREAGGVLGASRDNVYFISGIDVTDPIRGSFGANLNTEIIQEQNVLTGGIPAELGGAPGLIVNVVTKSGGNRYGGSINYYFQSDALVEDDRNASEASFETTDSAFTLGGPLVRDRAWFFGSYRATSRAEDVVSRDGGGPLRRVEDASDQGFLKLSWAAADSDHLTLTVLSDPTELDGSFDRSLANNRDLTTETGGERFGLRFSHLFGNAFFELAAGRHDGDFSRFAVDSSPRNDILFRAGEGSSQQDEQLGGFGRDDLNQHRNGHAKAAIEWHVGGGRRHHTVRAGVDFQERSNRRRRTIPGGATYTSLDLGLRGLSAGELSTGSFTGLAFDVFRSSHFNGLVRGIGQSPNRDALMVLLDLDADGSLTPDEVARALVFGATDGNPDGRVNYDRTLQRPADLQQIRAEGWSLYLQDTLQWRRWSFNLGVRAERSTHFATDGSELYTFDWEIAPRLSAVYDLRGDGRHKLSAHYGRYYDSIRLNIANTAGTLTEAFDEQQTFVDGEWITYQSRGGDGEQSVFYAPATETPYTDDFQLDYQVDLGRQMSFEVTFIDRRTRDLLETYDLSLYAVGADGTTDYPGDVDHPDSLWLGLDYFGFTAHPGADVAIATLAGGRRDWRGFELVFRKRFSHRWQALASYTHADADGNSTSDSSTDLQGDLLYLDPRAPGRDGRLPGLIEDLVKLAASYRWDGGFEIGGTYRWNSGTVSSLSEVRSRRNVPLRVATSDRFEFAGIRDRWLDAEAVGSFENDSWGTLDLRLLFQRRLGKIGGEIFVDVFNVLDDQATVRRQDLAAGSGGLELGEGISFVAPRRYFLGVRLSY